jgi:hypothetical protein
LIAILLALLAQDSDWKAGFASVKVTPEAPVHLAGYATRDKPFERVAADVYVKALCLEDSKGRRAVLVTADVIGWNAGIAEPVFARIMEGTGLPREAILLNASHNHSGPRLSLAATPRENIPEGEVLKSIAYTTSFQEKAAAAAVEAAGRLQPARLSWGVGKADFVANRRTADGPTDRSVPVLRIDGPDGRLRGALFGAACHNTALNGRSYELCGDYAGFAQAWLEAKAPGVQAMFMMGCGGDANPEPRGTMEHARAHGEALGREAWRVLSGPGLATVGGPLVPVQEKVDLPFRKLSKEEAEKLVFDRHLSAVAKQALALLAAGERLPTHYPAPVSVWQFGGDLTLVALPGETVVDYVQSLKEGLGGERLWIAGYCNDKIGYLPSKRVAEEGGYEAQGLIKGYGGPGFFAPGVEDVVVRAVRRLAEKAGRK